MIFIMVQSSVPVIQSPATVVHYFSYLNQWSEIFLSKSFGQVILFQFSSFPRKTNLTKGRFLQKNMHIRLKVIKEITCLLMIINCIPERIFLKVAWLLFWKKNQQTKKHAKFPSRQRIFFFICIKETNVHLLCSEWPNSVKITAK